MISLYEEKKTACVIMNKTTVPDGEGGYTTRWTEGAPLDAAITFDSSLQAKVAEVQGVKSLYTITTNKSAVLQFHDVIKRLSDGKIFRITSDGDDKYTPASATLNMRQVSAEEWSI